MSPDGRLLRLRTGVTCLHPHVEGLDTRLDLAARVLAEASKLIKYARVGIEFAAKINEDPSDGFLSLRKSILIDVVHRSDLSKIGAAIVWHGRRLRAHPLYCSRRRPSGPRQGLPSGAWLMGG